MTSQIELGVTGMTCTSCSSRVQRKLNKLDGVDASVNYSTETATVSFDPSSTSTQLLIDDHRTVYACDPSPDMTRVLHHQLPEVPVWRATAEATGLADNAVDAIACAQTWHWVDPAEASAETDRVIRDGGCLVLCWNTLAVHHPWVLRLSRIMHSGDVQREGFYPTVHAPWQLEREVRTEWVDQIPVEHCFELMATRSYWLKASKRTRAKMEANLTWYLYERLGFDEGQIIPLPYRTDAFVYRR